MNFFKILLVLIFPLLVSSSNLKRKENPSDEAPKSKIARLSVDEAEISGVTDIASCDNLNQRKRKENPSDEYPEQKVARISADEAEISDVIDAFSSDLEPKPNLASHNDSVSLFKTPEVLLFMIYSYLKCPYSSLPFVCKAFNESLKKYPLAMHLNSITSMSFAGPLKPSKDLARLLTLDRSYLNEKLDQFLEIGTYYTYNLKLNYPPLACQVVGFSLKKKDTFQQTLDISRIAAEIMQEGYLESFLAILHQFPDLKLKNLRIDVAKFLKFIRTDNSTFIDNLHRLIQVQENTSPFLPYLFSIPNVPNSEFDKIFNSIVLSNPNLSINFIFKSIGGSFSLINFDDLSKEEIQSIQERNERYILEYSRRKSSDFGPEFAHLCCNMVSSDYKDTLLTREFLDKMVTFVNNDLKEEDENEYEDDAQSHARDYIRTLSIIAIKRGFTNLFIQLQTITFGENEYIYNEHAQLKYFQEYEMERFEKDHPKFFASLPCSIFRNLFGVYNSLNLLRYKRLTLEHVSFIHDFTARMTAIVELAPNPETLKAAISNFVGSGSNLLAKLFENIINYSENPARTVHKVFSALKYFEQFESKFDSINGLLSTETYLESLLKPENEDIFEFPVEGIIIKINHNTFKLFADFAKLMGAERIALLLKHIVIDWRNIVYTSNLLASDFDSFFKAIGLNIKEYEIIKNKTTEDLKAIESIKKDSRCLFVEPKVDSKYIFEVLLQEANLAHQYKLDRKYLPNGTNPFAFRYFGVYD